MLATRRFAPPPAARSVERQRRPEKVLSHNVVFSVELESCGQIALQVKGNALTMGGRSTFWRCLIAQARWVFEGTSALGRRGALPAITRGKFSPPDFASSQVPWFSRAPGWHSNTHTKWNTA